MSIVIATQGKDVSDWVHTFNQLRPDLHVYVYPDVLNKEEVSLAIAWNHPLGIFNEFPNLKCISSMGAGVDHVLRDPNLPAQAQITRVVDENLTIDMGEFVIALIMSHLKGLYHYKQAEADHNWKPEPYHTIKGTRVGIMGMGVLGLYTAICLQQIGFTVCGWARTPKNKGKIKIFAGEEQLGEFLANTDILVCLLPLTPTTENILNKSLFKQLPQGAFIINVARGKHLVEEDLIEMIDSGQLSGACLDVFREEPLPKGHTFWKHPKIHITPHIASVTKPESVVAQILENYRRLQQNEPLLNTVSTQNGY